MCLAEGSTRDTTFVSLAACNEVAHSASELLVVVDQIADVCSNECAINSPHVHFPVLVDGNRSGKCAHDFAGSPMGENFTSRSVFKHPSVEGRCLLVSDVHVVFYRVKI